MSSNPPPPAPRLAHLLADYPPELFDERFHQLCELAHEYCIALAIDLVTELGIDTQTITPSTAAEVEARTGFDPRFALALRWLLNHLVQAGLMCAEGHGEARRYWRDAALPATDVANLRARGIAMDASSVANWDVLDAAARAYPAVASGTSSGERALLAGDAGVAPWLAYFSNANRLYAINNQVSAIAAIRHLDGIDNARILELGAGSGSAARALLDCLGNTTRNTRIADYLVTEPDAFFRRQCQRALRETYAQFPVRVRDLDIDKPWRAQDAADGHFDLVWCVNVMHVADDLEFALREARNALAPGGLLIIGECLRPFPGQTIWPEFAFQILDEFMHVKTHPRHRPTAGFLTAEQWQAALRHAGFSECEVVPDHARIREVYPRFFTGAIRAR